MLENMGLPTSEKQSAAASRINGQFVVGFPLRRLNSVHLTKIRFFFFVVGSNSVRLSGIGSLTLFYFLVSLLENVLN